MPSGARVSQNDSELTTSYYIRRLQIITNQREGPKESWTGRALNRKLSCPQGCVTLSGDVRQYTELPAQEARPSLSSQDVTEIP